MYENVATVYTGEWAEDHPSDADLFLAAGSDLETYARYHREGGRLLFAGSTPPQQHLYATRVILVVIKGGIYIHAGRASEAGTIDIPGFKGTDPARVSFVCGGTLPVITFMDKNGHEYTYEYEEEVKEVLKIALGLIPQVSQKGRKLRV